MRRVRIPAHCAPDVGTDDIKFSVFIPSLSRVEEHHRSGGKSTWIKEARIFRFEDSGDVSASSVPTYPKELSKLITCTLLTVQWQGRGATRIKFVLDEFSETLAAFRYNSGPHDKQLFTIRLLVAQAAERHELMFALNDIVHDLAVRSIGPLPLNIYDLTSWLVSDRSQTSPFRPTALSRSPSPGARSSRNSSPKNYSRQKSSQRSGKWTSHR